MAEDTVVAEETKESSVELSKEQEKLVEQIDNMTVLELSKFVKALEDRYGVVAAAPVAVAAAGGAGGAGDAGADEASEVSVIITDAGGNKIQVLKEVREITGLGLKEAKELVDNVPKAVKEGIEKDEAEKIKASLEEKGAKVEIK